MMKIRGVNNMPDFIQVRDGSFTLVAYFRADRPEQKRFPCLRNITEDKLRTIIDDLPYGHIRKIVY